MKDIRVYEMLEYSSHVANLVGAGLLTRHFNFFTNF